MQHLGVKSVGTDPVTSCFPLYYIDKLGKKSPILHIVSFFLLLLKVYAYFWNLKLSSIIKTSTTRKSSCILHTFL